jgi:hypothetical protein
MRYSTRKPTSESSPTVPFASVKSDWLSSVTATKFATNGSASERKGLTNSIPCAIIKKKGKELESYD